MVSTVPCSDCLVTRILTVPLAVQSGCRAWKKPIRWFVPEATTRVNCFFSNPSWANADDESSPKANAASRRFFILILRAFVDYGGNRHGFLDAQRTFML